MTIIAAPEMRHHLRSLWARAQYRLRSESHQQIHQAAADQMHDAQRQHLHRHRPFGPGVGKLRQQRQKQQKHLGVQAADAHALAGPAQPGVGTLIFTGAGHRRVQQHVATDPQEVSRSQQGKRRQRQRVADQQRADARHYDRNHQQMAKQQAGDGGHHHPAANARRDHIGPIHTRRDHQQNRYRPKSGEQSERHTAALSNALRHTEQRTIALSSWKKNGPACRGGRQNRSTDGKNILKGLKCAFNYLPEIGISGEILLNG